VANALGCTRKYAFATSILTVGNIVLLGTLNDEMDFYTQIVLWIDFGFIGLMVLEIWLLFRLQGRVQFWKEGWNRFQLSSLIVVGLIYAAYPGLLIYFHDRLGIRHACEFVLLFYFWLDSCGNFSVFSPFLFSKNKQNKQKNELFACCYCSCFHPQDCWHGAIRENSTRSFQV
jgi:hypothetical protein